MRDAFALLPIVQRRFCRLCRLSLDWQERLWSWHQEGVTCQEISERLADAGVSTDRKAVARHKRHLGKAVMEYITLSPRKESDKVSALKLQLQVETKKLTLAKLAKAREERVRLALETLRDVLGDPLYQKAEAFLRDLIAQSEGGEDT